MAPQAPQKEYSGDFWLQFDPQMAPQVVPGGSRIKKWELSWRAGGSPLEKVTGDPKIDLFSTLTPDLSREPLF